ncbi:hypothetical protein B0H14DRAFT_2630373 [Mycena olivaceomarginata]|nr:hypothetical protein B0H14DRAFT_2630373 [Mycena olivaceomarginata]
MVMKREDATRDMSRWLVLIPPFFLSLYLPPHVLAHASSPPSPPFSSWSVGKRDALSVPASKNLLDTEVADSEPVRHARERAADIHGYQHILSVLEDESVWGIVKH